MSARVSMWVVAFLLIGNAPATGQFEDYPLWLERSYFLIPPVHHAFTQSPSWYPVQGRDTDDQLLFEARISPQLYLFNTLESDVFTGRDAQWAFGVAFTPGFVVRQLQGLSSPLRSPSFMPKFAVQAHWRPAKDGVNAPVTFLTFQLEHGHHSNGGEPCSFEEQVVQEQSDGSFDCELLVPTAPADLTVDTTGSFSTNYMRVGAFWSRWALSNQAVDWSVGAGLQFELHPEGFKFFGAVGGGLGPEMYAIYGPKRVRARAQFTRRMAGWRVGLDAEYMHIFSESRPSPDASPHAWTADLTFVSQTGVERWNGLFAGWGIAVRYYQGQDYYNQLFFRDIRRLHIGLLVIDQFDWMLGT